MAKKKDLLVLLTNDDGIHAPGLNTLAKQMKSFGEIMVVAPDREQSASSHSLTLTRPLRIIEFGNNRYAVDGTPTDAVMVAVHGLLKNKRKPDLLISGINHGANMGDDVSYSGTVAAAIEGSIIGIPSMAVSLINPEKGDFVPAAKAVRKIALWVVKNGLPQFSFLNINMPYIGSRQFKGVKVTRLGRRIYNDVVVEKVDPRGKNYYWIAGDPEWMDVEGSDFAAVSRGMVSISPLKVDMTNIELHEELKDVKIKL
ncbi:MAG: 5'/3'-nucleotidase SurE [candidate division Zixibacteria bacterium]|nr:5'/3'-nucleotidase SurE [candidate division Zixibacteria bacterium]